MNSNGTTASLYRLEGVGRRYGTVTAVADLSLVVDECEVVVVAGPSGSGKTTLLQLLGALDRPSEGRILFEGTDLAACSDGELARVRREEIGFVFQQFNLIPTLTAAGNVQAAMAPAGAGRDEMRRRAHELLAAVGLEQRIDHLPSQLSGGEQQRVAIARALANRPRVLLADEPTGNLDSEIGREILDILIGLAGERGHTVILVTHDETIAAAAPRVVRMRDGRLAGTVAPQPAVMPA